jgi:hypothetical protein
MKFEEIRYLVVTSESIVEYIDGLETKLNKINRIKWRKKFAI